VTALPELPGKLTYYRGRVGLQAILRALGIGRGDTVLIQAFTCLAVTEAVFACGAAPAFADIEPEGFNLDPERLEERIDSRTRAIVVQHTFGLSAQMEPIMAIARRRGLPVIEDCCHTYFSRSGEAPVGSFGAAAFYSFEWGKPMILGLGGAVVARDPALARILEIDNATRLHEPPLSRQLRLEMQYRAFQLLYRPSFYWAVRRAFRALSALGVAEGSFHSLQDGPSPEFGWRMAPLLARRFPAKLAKLPAEAAVARRIVQEYRQRLGGAIVHPRMNPQTDVLVRYPLRATSKAELLARAREARVELAGWYETPVHPIPLARLGSVGLDVAEFPQAQRRCEEIVSLPVNARVTPDSIERAARLFAS
jgi:perosamine synthetase